MQRMLAVANHKCNQQKSNDNSKTTEISVANKTGLADELMSVQCEGAAKFRLRPGVKYEANSMRVPRVENLRRIENFLTTLRAVVLDGSPMSMSANLPSTVAAVLVLLWRTSAEPVTTYYVYLFIYARGGELAARWPNAARLNIWYGLHQNFRYPC